MANRLKMATIQAILQLHSLHWSDRRIARELGIHRETVAKYLRGAQPDPKPAKAPSGSEKPKPATFPDAPAHERPDPAEARPSPGAFGAELYPKPAIAPSGSGAGRGARSAATGPPPEARDPALPSVDHDSSAPRVGRASACEPFRELIGAWLAAGLSAQRVYQDLVIEQGYAGSYYSVRRFVQKLEARRPLPMRRMECAAGCEAQVDYGRGAPIVTPNGKRRTTHVFRLVLSHSRKGYSEVSFRQTTEDFLRALENAFHALGGVPQTIVIDNLKAAVRHPDWYDPELTPKLSAFCAHYGTVILPARPYTPRHKGKVERGIGYVKGNALRRRAFDSLAAQNDHLAHWEATVADKRIHGTTRRQVGQVFAEVERQALLPLPAERFPCFHEAQRSVNRDGHVEVAKAYYSVPPEYLGRTVWVRWDARLVRVFNLRREQIAVHARHEQGRFSTEARHIAPEKISGLERGVTWLLNKVRLVGPRTAAWAEALLTARGIEGTRVLLGLIALTKRHSSAALERACESALSHGEFRLRALRAMLARQPQRVQAALPFLEEHPLIRPLDDYARVVASALERKDAAQRVFDEAALCEQATLRFERHGRADESARRERQSPGANVRRGLRDIHPPRSGYSSPGCSPAEPGSASPDSSSLRPPFPPSPGETSDDQ